MTKLKNIRHEMFAKNLIKTNGDQTKAYQMTYPKATYHSANTLGSRIIKNKPEIILRVEEICNDHGLDINYCVGKIKKLTEAKSHRLVNQKLVEVEDNSIQLEATKVGLKLHGALKEQHNNTFNDNRSINLLHTDPTKVTALLQSITKLNESLDLIDNQNKNVIEIDYDKTPDTMESPE